MTGKQSCFAELAKAIERSMREGRIVREDRRRHLGRTVPAIEEVSRDERIAREKDTTLLKEERRLAWRVSGNVNSQRTPWHIQSLPVADGFDLADGGLPEDSVDGGVDQHRAHVGAPGVR